MRAHSNQQVEGGWYRLTCTAELQPGDYNFRLVLAHAAGTVYFDDFQLEKGDTAGAYNYVSNGHFGFDTYAITGSANAAIVSGEDHVLCV